MIYDKKKKNNLIEFIAIFLIFVVPPMVNTNTPTPFFLNYKKNTATTLIFLIISASYEELLYRVYLPFRLKSFFYIKPTSSNKKTTFFLITECIPLICFAFAHVAYGLANVGYAFCAGTIFRKLYTFIKNKFNCKIAFICVLTLHALHNIILIFSCRVA